MYEVEGKKRPEYHTLSLPQKINTVILFFGCILPESLCTYMSILKHPHTQMASCYTCYSASVSWICFHTCKYRLTSSVNSSLVITGHFLKTPLFFFGSKKKMLWTHSRGSPHTTSCFHALSVLLLLGKKLHLVMSPTLDIL